MAYLESGRVVTWPADDAILLVVTDGANYNHAVRQVAQAMAHRFQQGVYVTANRPHHVLRETLRSADIDLSRFFFIDCVTSLTGIMPAAEPSVMHVESPTMLEKMAMRAEQVLRRNPGKPRFLILDSLSTLSVYNGSQTVAELAHGLITKLRIQKIAAALILVEKQAGEELLDNVKPLCDDVLRV